MQFLSYLCQSPKQNQDSVTKEGEKGFGVSI